MHYGQTEIILCHDAVDLGEKAAEAVAATIRHCLTEQDEVRIVFAAGESQITFLAALVDEDVQWDRVVCISMDDFWEPKMPGEFTCAHQICTALYDKVNPKAYHIPAFDAPDGDAEIARFAKIVREAPIDITCQGIGTSGHLAFNEPDISDFNDPEPVRMMDIAEQSKKQLMADPNFKALGYIPEKGITLTVPALLGAKHVFTIVPLGLKRAIVTEMMSHDAPTTKLPATILHDAPGTLFLDRDSCPAALLAEAH